MKKIWTWEKVKALEDVGFRWHAYGTLSSDGSKYDYYKGDTLTAAQKQKLKDRFGDSVRFFGSRAQYAPEIRGAIVGFLIGKSPASRTKKNPRNLRYRRVRRNFEFKILTGAAARKDARRSKKRLKRMKLIAGWKNFGLYGPKKKIRGKVHKRSRR